MLSSVGKTFCSLALGLFLSCTGMSVPSFGADALPIPLQEEAHAQLSKVGSGVYRKFGFSIYRATLWAPNSVWSPDQPYVLELRYMRSLSKGTLVDAVMDGIGDQDVADQPTLDNWEKQLNDVMPSVVEGDELIGLYVPQKSSSLFYNGAKIGSLDDQAFGKAFFNIWLGDNADEVLRAKLLAARIN